MSESKILFNHLYVGGLDGRRPLILNGTTALVFSLFSVSVFCKEENVFYGDLNND